MIRIKGNSLDQKILKLLLESYPMTVGKLGQLLEVRDRELDLALKKLIRRKIIRIEPAGEDVFIQLLRRDFNFENIKRDQKRSINIKKPKTPKKSLDTKIYG